MKHASVKYQKIILLYFLQKCLFISQVSETSYLLFENAMERNFTLLWNNKLFHPLFQVFSSSSFFFLSGRVKNEICWNFRASKPQLAQLGSKYRAKISRHFGSDGKNLAMISEMFNRIKNIFFKYISILFCN